MKVWRRLLPGGFPPGRREQELSFFPVRENRSRARARTWNEPRACETRGRKRQGARLARRRRAAGRLNGPLGRKPPAGKGNARNAKEQSSSFSGVSVRGGTFGPTFYVFMEIWRGLFDRQASSRPQGTGDGLSLSRRKQKPCAGAHLKKTACVRDWAKATNTVRDLPAAGALLAGLTALRAANRRLAWETPEMPRSKAQLFGRFCAWGYVWPHVLRIHESLARAFVRQISFWPQRTGVRLFPRPGKTGARRGPHTRNQPRACEAGRKHKHGA